MTRIIFFGGEALCQSVWSKINLVVEFVFCNLYARRADLLHKKNPRRFFAEKNFVGMSKVFAEEQFNLFKRNGVEVVVKVDVIRAVEQLLVTYDGIVAQ